MAQKSNPPKKLPKRSKLYRLPARGEHPPLKAASPLRQIAHRAVTGRVL